MSSDEKTRVAIVRCDTHAYWFGVFMDDPDVLTLATPHDDAPTRPGIHNYFKDGNEYTRLKIQRVPGFVISKVFDRLFDQGEDENGNPIMQYGSYPGRVEEFSRTFLSRPVVCDTIEQAAQDIDAAYIADSSSPGDGADHLELARPFLERSNTVLICPMSSESNSFANPLIFKPAQKTVIKAVGVISRWTPATRSFANGF